MRRFTCLCLLGSAMAGCGGGDNANGDARTDRVILVDASTDGEADASRPDAGMAVGRQLSSTGAWYLQISSPDQLYVVFADTTINQLAHVVKIDNAAEQNLGGPFSIAAQGDAFWVAGTAVILHEANGAAFWRAGMAAAMDVQATGLGTNTGNIRAFARISPDGDKVAFLVNNTTTAANLDLFIQSVGGASPVLATANIRGPDAVGNCGLAGAWSSPTKFILLGCDVDTGSTGTNLLLKQYTIADPLPATIPAPIVLSDAANDDVDSFILSTATDGAADNHFLAYHTVAGLLRFVDLTAGTPAPVTIETIAAPVGGSAFGLFRGSTLFYISTPAIKKVDVSLATPTPVTLVSSGAAFWALSSVSGSAFSADGSRAIFFTVPNTTMGQFGNMSAITTTGGATTPAPLNNDNNGYPGDDAYSHNSNYIFWYDQVVANTNGIGTIHARLYSDTGAGRVVGPGGFFIRETAMDAIAAVMANSSVDPDGITHVGDLLKVDVSGAAQPVLVVDQITYMDMLTSGAQVIYSRRDGVYITGF